MAFALFTLLSVFALGVLVSVFRFRASDQGATLLYSTWIKQATVHFLKNPGDALVVLADRFRRWSDLEYPGWKIWILAVLSASTVYQAVSGIGAALFFRNGMTGIFLLLHMAAGALFALSLAADLALHAREHVRDSLPVSPASFVFWIFMGCAVLLTLTALASMIEFFPLRIQLTLIGIHRYAATVIVLAAVGRFELSGRK
jgi:hypothetical protein